MTISVDAEIVERVNRIENVPAVPAILLPLLNVLRKPEGEVDVNEVVRLVSYDKAIAMQCLRMAGSALFGLPRPPESVSAAVLSLGLKRVENILLATCMGDILPAKKWVLDPVGFWRHSLGCAMVCRKLSEKIGGTDPDKAYLGGLLHDIGFLANCLAFSDEFAPAVQRACDEQIPLDQAERITMGFSHCETGRALGRKWCLSEDMVQVIAHHHAPETSETAHSLVALVHLSDLLCRMRGLGYGYYERLKADLIFDPAWSILLQEHRNLEGVDLARFTFEIDGAVADIYELVSAVFAPAPVRV
jgi:putative nucleotidyltransferase with HDIG domain